MMHTEGDRITYQLFSGGGGAWGPVKRSGELTKSLRVHAHRPGMVVCGDAVHWLAGPDGHITCTVALDVRTGRTWATRLPDECRRLGIRTNRSYIGEQLRKNLIIAIIIR